MSYSLCCSDHGLKVPIMKLFHLASLAATVLTVAACLPAQATPRIVGYFAAWGIYGRNFHVTDIPAQKVTHINYAFAKLTNGKIALGDPYADIDKFYPGDSWAPGSLRGSFNQLIKLKRAHPGLKTLISVGGWTWSSPFSDACLTANSRATLARSCVDFVAAYQFDGIDIDWEYPVGGGLSSNVTRPQDKQNFTLFLRELRRQLDQKTLTTGVRYLLTIAAPASPMTMQNLEVALIHPLLDWINLMTYDLHGPWPGGLNPVTHFNAPLYEIPGDPTPQPARSEFNVAAAIDAYLALGVPEMKLGLGLGFYGRGYDGVSNTANGLFGTYTGPAVPGTWEAGVFDYDALAANFVNKNGFTRYWNDHARAPYVWNPSRGTMISYDDARSIREKAWFAKARNLGGVMFWEFSPDRKQTLVSSAYDELYGRHALRADADILSAAAPSKINLSVEGPPGKLYVLLASYSGTYPGIALPGGTLPLQVDWFTNALSGLANTAFLPGASGNLDAQGKARAAIDFTQLPSVPLSLIGTHMNFCSWIFDKPGSLNGRSTNAIDVSVK